MVLFLAMWLAINTLSSQGNALINQSLQFQENRGRGSIAVV